MNCRVKEKYQNHPVPSSAHLFMRSPTNVKRKSWMVGLLLQPAYLVCDQKRLNTILTELNPKDLCGSRPRKTLRRKPQCALGVMVISGIASPGGIRQMDDFPGIPCQALLVKITPCQQRRCIL